MTPLVEAGMFLSDTLIGFYLMFIALRFVLQIIRADFYNPLCQFTMKMTNIIIVPTRRVIPSIMGYDTACIFWLLIITALKLTISGFLLIGQPPAAVGLMVWTFGDLLKLFISLYTFAIILGIILSWVAPGGQHPIARVMQQLTNPVMGRVRRIMPTVAGFDISPIPILIGLQLLSILLANPVIMHGRKLAY